MAFKLGMIWRVAALLLIVVFSGCSKDPRTKVKIVNLEGKSRSIVTRTPDLNLQALQQQGNIDRSNIVIVNDKNSESYFSRFAKKIPFKKSDEVELAAPVNSKPAAQNPANDFGNFSSQAIDKSFSAQSSAGAGAAQVVAPVQEVNYDLSNANKAATKKSVVQKEVKPATSYPLKTKDPKIKKAVTPKKSKAVKKGKYFVQVGSFSKYKNAQNSLKYMSRFHSGEINTINRKKNKIHRVVLGPFVKRSEAGKVIKSIKSAGKQAILVIK